MLGALNGDFKSRKKESQPVGLVSHVGDILVHRVCRRLNTFSSAVFIW